MWAKALLYNGSSVSGVEYFWLSVAAFSIRGEVIVITWIVFMKLPCFNRVNPLNTSYLYCCTRSSLHLSVDVLSMHSSASGGTPGPVGSAYSWSFKLSTKISSTFCSRRCGGGI